MAFETIKKKYVKCKRLVVHLYKTIKCLNETIKNGLANQLKEQYPIDDLIDALKREEVALHKEGTAEGYLGVDIKHDSNQITLQQKGLTQRVIEALGLDS